MLVENWTSVIGYEGYYEVSDKGNFRSVERNVKHSDRCSLNLKSKPINQRISKEYFVITLSKEGKQKTFRSNVLIYYSFNTHEVQDSNFVIDHNDNIKANNFLSNLKRVTNRVNLSKDKKPISGFTGVYLNAKTQKHQAKVNVNGKSYSLGLFNTPEEASEAYKFAVHRIGLGFTLKADLKK